MPSAIRPYQDSAAAVEKKGAELVRVPCQAEKQGQQQSGAKQLSSN